MTQYYRSLNTSGIWMGLMAVLGLGCPSEAGYVDVFNGFGTLTGVIAVKAGSPAGAPMQLVFAGRASSLGGTDLACASPPPPSPPIPPSPPPPPTMACVVNAYIDKTAGVPLDASACSLYIFYMRSMYAVGLQASFFCIPGEQARAGITGVVESQEARDVIFLRMTNDAATGRSIAATFGLGRRPHQPPPRPPPPPSPPPTPPRPPPPPTFDTGFTFSYASSSEAPPGYLECTPMQLGASAMLGYLDAGVESPPACALEGRSLSTASGQWAARVSIGIAGESAYGAWVDRMLSEPGMRAYMGAAGLPCGGEFSLEHPDGSNVTVSCGQAFPALCCAPAACSDAECSQCTVDRAASDLGALSTPELLALRLATNVYLISQADAESP
ncbi:hypothetical protein FOA52_001884 [Chlamydomonas sp. UWO 241]|nr:hypothetical protein FOA52_001884 [Chlamydomonas sp. UWO 241]